MKSISQDKRRFIERIDRERRLFEEGMRGWVGILLSKGPREGKKANSNNRPFAWVNSPIPEAHFTIRAFPPKLPDFPSPSRRRHFAAARRPFPRTRQKSPYHGQLLRWRSEDTAVEGGEPPLRAVRRAEGRAEATQNPRAGEPRPAAAPSVQFLRCFGKFQRWSHLRICGKFSRIRRTAMFCEFWGGGSSGVQGLKGCWLVAWSCDVQHMTAKVCVVPVWT
jgi:hypothetical protein